MNTYFCSDLHFSHSKICSFTERKLFTNPEEHTGWLINIWNSQVTKADKVIHLGDFSFSHKYEEVASVLRRLNGQKFFIKGNHDRSEILDSLKLSGLIQNWYHYKEVKIGDTPTCLFHFPIAAWHRQHYGSIHLHGHCHSSFQGNGKILDVGIDNAYKLYGEHRLFSEQEVLTFMKDRPLYITEEHRK